MRVIVPYNEIHPKAEAALQRFAPEAERIRTFCGVMTCGPMVAGAAGCAVLVPHCHHERCQRTYGDLLRQLWEAGEDFMVIEHDIEIVSIRGESVVEHARRCPRSWCVWPYPGPGWWAPADGHHDPLLRGSLGCTRFRATLMRKHPNLMDVAIAEPNGMSGDWRRLDVTILHVLRNLWGNKIHEHGQVRHHHVYQQYGCACGDPRCGLRAA